VKWFRFYHSIIDSAKVRPLPHRAQLAYVWLLCLASEYRERTATNTGATGVDTSTAAWRTREPMLSRYLPLLRDAGLVRLDEDGLIEIIDWQNKQMASDDSAPRQRHSRDKKRDASRDGHALEVDTDTERETEKKNQGGEAPLDAHGKRARPAELACPYDDLVELYHTLLPDNPRVMVLTKGRKTALRERWRDFKPRYGTPPTKEGGLDFWRRYFAFVARSEFLTGHVPGKEGRAPFMADIDFLLRPSKMVEIIEGKYHERVTA
jgi:hypothetical protein